VTFDFSTAVALKGKIDAGERFDVAILTPALIEALSASGAIGGTPVAFARTGVGVGIKTGAAVPDIRTPEALKATLLAASSVAFTAEGQSRATVDKAYAALGIADAMRAKSMLTGPGGGPVAVAEGKAELVLTLVSEILPVPGVRLVGPLPDALQGYVSFSAARSAMSREAAAADALLRFLSGPETAAALRSQGMTPAQP
jgi:molybdate transport system substrate-binding protein